MNPNAVARANTTSGQTKMITSSATATRTDTISGMFRILKQYVRNGRKTMTDRLILTILIALACPLLLPIVIEEEKDTDNDKP